MVTRAGRFRFVPCPPRWRIHPKEVQLFVLFQEGNTQWNEFDIEKTRNSHIEFKRERVPKVPNRRSEYRVLSECEIVSPLVRNIRRNGVKLP